MNSFTYRLAHSSSGRRVCMNYIIHCTCRHLQRNWSAQWEFAPHIDSSYRETKELTELLDLLTPAVITERWAAGEDLLPVETFTVSF